MKKQIDSLSSITGWAVTSPTTIETLSEKTMIAGLNTSSLMIHFPASSVTATRKAVKTFASAIDITGYNILIFSIWSQQYGIGEYTKPADFYYKVKINNTNEYFIPIRSTFCDVSIYLSGVTQITKIEITALHNNEDYIVISEMVVEKQEFPLDILDSLVEAITYETNKEYGYGIQIGTMNATAGATKAIIGGNAYFVDRTAVIYIREGSNSETHQIADFDGQYITFHGNYDGKTLLNSYTSATVYLKFPAYNNPEETDVRLPGIAITGFSPEAVDRGEKGLREIDSFVSNSTFFESESGQKYAYMMKITAEARQNELLGQMCEIIRRVISRESLWINGRKHDIWFEGGATEQGPTAGIDIISQVQYTVRVEVREHSINYDSLVQTTDINITVDEDLVS